MMGSATPHSLWAIQWWEVLVVTGAFVGGWAFETVFGRRARANRAKLRRRRRAERALVQRTRAW